jgi:hypothetical protein
MQQRSHKGDFPDMNQIDSAYNFLASHSFLLLGMGWTFSAAMSTMPPLPNKAGFWQTWVYKFLQAIAANFNKHDNPPGIGGSSAIPETTIVQHVTPPPAAK